MFKMDSPNRKNSMRKLDKLYQIVCAIKDLYDVAWRVEDFKNDLKYEISKAKGDYKKGLERALKMINELLEEENDK